MKKTAFLIISLVMILSMLAACAAQPAATEEAPQTDPVATEEVEVEETSNDTLTFAMTTDPKSLDPRTLGGDYNWTILSYMVERLCEFDMATGEFEPVLATSWEQLDTLTWQFKLREGVTFHNGEPFNADVVKYSVETMIDPEGGWTNSSWLADVDEVVVVDDYTVNLVTKKPIRAFLTNLGFLYLMPPVAGEELGVDFGVQPIGTGAYKFVRYVPNDHIELVRNEDYWGEKPNFKNMIIKFLPEDSTRLAALEAGEVAMIPNVAPDAIANLEANEDLDVVVADPARVMHLAFVMDKAPLGENIKLREALNYAVNRQELVDTIMMGLAKVADRHFYHPNVPNFNDDLEPYTYDPEKAKELLAEAGYPDGITLTMGCPNGRYLRDKMVCEALVGQYAESGVTLEMEALEWGAFWDKAIVNHEYDLFFLGWVSTSDAYTQLVWWWQTGDSQINYSNPEVDEYISLTQSAETAEESVEAYKKVQELVWNDITWVPMYFQPNIYAQQSNLKGVVLSEAVPNMDFTKAYFED